MKRNIYNCIDFAEVRVELRDLLYNDYYINKLINLIKTHTSPTCTLVNNDCCSTYRIILSFKKNSYNKNLMTNMVDMYSLIKSVFDDFLTDYEVYNELRKIYSYEEIQEIIQGRSMLFNSVVCGYTLTIDL